MLLSPPDLGEGEGVGSANIYLAGRGGMLEWVACRRGTSPRAKLWLWRR